MVWAAERRQLYKAIRMRDGIVGATPSWLAALVDQVESLNAAQITWLAYTRQFMAIGPRHTIDSDSTWSARKRPLMMNYYAHVTKLFEDKPGAFAWLRQNRHELPENASALLRIIECLWIAGGRPLIEIRHEAAFHRQPSQKTRRDVQQQALGNLNVGVVPALARLATALCLQLGAHWKIDLVITPLPGFRCLECSTSGSSKRWTVQFLRSCSAMAVFQGLAVRMTKTGPSKAAQSRESFATSRVRGSRGGCGGAI